MDDELQELKDLLAEAEDCCLQYAIEMRLEANRLARKLQADLEADKAEQTSHEMGEWSSALKRRPQHLE